MEMENNRIFIKLTSADEFTYGRDLYVYKYGISSIEPYKDGSKVYLGSSKNARYINVMESPIEVAKILTDGGDFYD